MKLTKGTILVGINPYNHKKRKFKYLGRNKGLGTKSHPMALYDYKQQATVYVSLEYVKQWQIKPYQKERK